jgi:hypothetical protein
VRVLFVRHDHVSPHGFVGDAFADHGFDVEDTLVVPEEHYSTPNVHATFPDPTEYDALVPMGAPWGAWDDDRIGNWLLPELQWLRDADEAGHRKHRRRCRQVGLRGERDRRHDRSSLDLIEFAADELTKQLPNRLAIQRLTVKQLVHHLPVELTHCRSSPATGRAKAHSTV